MKRRVAMVSEGFGEYVAGLALGLRDHVDVLVVGPSAVCEKVEQWAPGVDVRRINPGRIRDPRSARLVEEAVAALRAFDPDVVHHQVGGDPWFSAAARLAARRCRARRVVTVHELRERLRDEDYWFTPLARRAAVGGADAVVALSDVVAARLRARYRKPTGWVHRNVLPEQGSLYRQLSPMAAPVEPATVVFFGRIRPYKGVAVLIEAGHRLAQSIPDFRLVVAGDGATAAELFPGGVPGWAELHLRSVADDEVAPLIDRAQVVAAPYLAASQSGVASVALGLGRPVVASDVGGLGEMVVPGRSGLLVPPGDVQALGDALNRVLSEPGLKEQLAQGALELARGQFSWESGTAQALAVYGSVDVHLCR